MSEQDTASLLNEAIDRLAAGDSIDTIVAQYGPRASDLRPMLEAGLLTRRASYPAAEIQDSLARIDSQVLPNLPLPPAFPYWLILPLLIGAGIIAVILAALSNAAIPSTPTPTMIMEATAAPLATQTSVALTPTISITLSPADAAFVSLFGVLVTDDAGQFTINGLPVDVTGMTDLQLSAGTPVYITGIMQEGRLIASGIATATPSAQSTAPSTVQSSETLPSAGSTTRLVIEGTVEYMEGNIITIHEQKIILPDIPALQVIQIGDVLRLDGQADAQRRFVEVQIIFISVDVIVNVDGQVWRDPGTCDAPPDWARTGASRWFARCASNPAPPVNSGGTSGGGSSGGGNNNDDDD